MGIELFVSRLNNTELVNSISSTGSNVTVDVADSNNFSVGNNAVILGKNGFKSLVGTIKLCCIDKALVYSRDYSERVIQLTTAHLDKCYDINTREHIRPSYVILTIKDKEVPNLELNKYPSITEISQPILQIRYGPTYIQIENKILGRNQRLFDLLPEDNFYITHPTIFRPF